MKRGKAKKLPRGFTPVLKVVEYNIRHQFYVLTDGEQKIFVCLPTESVEKMTEDPNFPIILLQYEFIIGRHRKNILYINKMEIFKLNFLPVTRFIELEDESHSFITPTCASPSPSTKLKLKFEFENFKIRCIRKRRSKNLCPQTKHVIARLMEYFRTFLNNNSLERLHLSKITAKISSAITSISECTIYTCKEEEKDDLPRCKSVIPRKKITKGERYEICAKSVDSFVRDYIRDQIIFHYRTEKPINISKFITEVSNDLKINDIDFLPSKTQFWRILHGMGYRYFLFFATILKGTLSSGGILF